jgi:hypothetical protein
MSNANNGHPAKRDSRESFIELGSPTHLEDPTLKSIDAKRPSSPHIMGLTHTVSDAETSKRSKPSLPTTPKPLFDRTSAPAHSRRRTSPNAHEQKDTEPLDLRPLPPTTNFLNPEERAELIRRNRKLAKVFGQTPEAEALVKQPKRIPLDTPHDRLGHHRFTQSLNLDGPPVHQKSIPVWPPPEGTMYLNASERLNPAPLSPDDSSLSQYSFDAQNTETGSVERLPSRRSVAHSRQSVTSFIDLSDDDVRSRRRTGTGASSLSILESMTEEEKAEEERRRKREKLARLHRFLGSHVPVNIALGLRDVDIAPSPPVPRNSLIANLASGVEEDIRRPFLRRRRSSSVVALPNSWSDDIDRLKEDLDEREKYLNVRRAVKMEKVLALVAFLFPLMSQTLCSRYLAFSRRRHFIILGAPLRRRSQCPGR